MDISIVTSCHNYGKYLPEWADSILKLNRKPQLVVIVDNGSTDDTPRFVQQAKELLESGGLEVRVQRIDFCNFGAARNAAVALSDTEWVMHFDADDMLMPHCLDDVAELAPRADVVALGYERCGDLESGPANRTMIYRDSCGQTTLDSKAPCSGVSPFRRSFWEKSPYRTDMDGGWDTALWLGFARLGARFVATTRPCFWYRQHADSIFNTRRVNERLSNRTGTKLQSLRRGDHGVSVIIPWKDDGGVRARVLEWMLEWYRTNHPEWQVIVGTYEHDDWCKGAAINRAVERCTGEVIVIADADCLVPARGLEEAVALVQSGRAPWVVPHTLVHRLTKEASERVMNHGLSLVADIKETDYDRAPYEGYAGGGISILTRASFDHVGKFPEGFRGWGAEDQAWALILDTLVGEHVRLPHNLWHFWHPPTARLQDPHYPGNFSLYEAYLKAKGDADLMWALTREGFGPAIKMMAREDLHLKDGRFIRANSVFMVPVLEAVDLEKEGIAARVPDAAFLRAQSRQLTLTIRAEQKRRNAEVYSEKAGASVVPIAGETINMAGALEIRREQIAIRREQARRNKEAIAEQERRRTEMEIMAQMSPSERRRRNNLMRRSRTSVPGAGSGVSIDTGGSPNSNPGGQANSTVESEGEAKETDPLAGVEFASDQARALAVAQGLVAADFAGLEPTSKVNKFSAADVRAVIKKKTGG